MGKTCVVLYELLNQSFHIGNVVVWPKLDWQAAEVSRRPVTSAWSDMEAPVAALQLPIMSRAVEHFVVAGKV